VLARRDEWPAGRCVERGDGGCRDSNLAAESKRGESGDVGRIAGDERGDGIFDVVVGRGECARVGDAPLEEPVVRMCVGDPENMLEPVMQMLCTRSLTEKITQRR